MRRPRRAGFSLVELLVVMAVIAILLTLTLPSADYALRGSALTQSGQMVSDQIAAARQAAIARNQMVFVRFYRLPRDVGADKEYSAVQTLAQDDAGTIRPLGRATKVNDNVMISDAEQYSTLIAKPTASGSEKVLGKDATYVGFRFYPDGSTDLDPVAADGWFLTLMNRVPPPGANLPKNFYTIRVDAHTGRIRTFRP